MKSLLIALAVALTISSCSADQKVLDKIQACEDRGGSPVYTENGFTGVPTQFLYCKPGDHNK